MNFKSRGWKLNTSIVVGLILGYIFSGVTQLTYPSTTTYTFSSDSILGFALGFGIVYIIWSLFQKKEQ